MAKSHNPNVLATATSSLPERFRNCRNVAQALIDTRQPLVRLLVLRPVRHPTDYELLRRGAISSIQSIRERLNQVREEDVRADVIRAVAHLRRVEEACRSCKRINARNLAQGKPFVCHAAELVGQRGNDAYRFRMDHAGRIIQSAQ